jgi:uncharacterized membrane protein
MSDTAKIVTEVLAYFCFAVAVTLAWYLAPFVVLRFALAVLYLVALRWAWRRGND